MTTSGGLCHVPRTPHARPLGSGATRMSYCTLRAGSSVFGLIVWSIVGSAAPPAGQIYEIGGSLLSTGMPNSGRSESSAQITYTVVLATDNLAWTYRWEDESVLKGNKAGPLFTEVGTDGHDVFQLNWFSKSDPATPKQQGAGSITPGSYPHADFLFGKVVWLAYCSGNFFRGDATTALPSLVGPPGEGDTMLSRANVMLDMGHTPLPGAVEFYDPGYRMVRLPQAGSSSSSMPTPLRHPPPYDSGYVNAHYKVNGWTNAGALIVPLQFTLNLFDLVPSPSGTLILSRTHEIIGHTRTIAALHPKMPSSASFLPRIPGRINVADLRFHRDASGILSPTNCLQPAQFLVIGPESGWLTRQEPDWVQRTMQLIDSHASDLERPRRHLLQVWMWAILVLLISTSVFVSTRIRRKEQV